MGILRDSPANPICIVSAQRITIRMHKEVLEWFRSRGRGYQTQISSLLRAYMEAHKAETTGAADGKQERTARP
ncbi:MAG: BrnA antitoxin family protein [Thermodesulfobacteriota bacterium]